MAADKLDNLCNFDTLFSKNLPHILEKIFFSLDYWSFKNCLEVSSEWKGVLTSDRYKTKRRSVFKREIVKDEKKLCTAVDQKNTDEVRMLLASGMVDVNCKYINEWTPLHWAAAGGHKEIAELLIESGADVNKADICGWTPLHWAAGEGHREVAELLIERDTDPNVDNDDGRTALHLAASEGQIEVAELLIKSGAEMDKADNHGKTPLHLAEEVAAWKKWKNGRREEVAAWAWGRHKEVADLLIKSGAYMDKADNDGDTLRKHMHWP